MLGEELSHDLMSSPYTGFRYPLQFCAHTRTPAARRCVLRSILQRQKSVKAVMPTDPELQAHRHHLSVAMRVLIDITLMIFPMSRAKIQGAISTVAMYQRSQSMKLPVSGSCKMKPSLKQGCHFQERRCFHLVPRPQEEAGQHTCAKVHVFGNHHSKPQ